MAVRTDLLWSGSTTLSNLASSSPYPAGNFANLLRIETGYSCVRFSEGSIMERIPTDKARQGGWGTQVLLVLVVGLALAGAAWLGLEFYGEWIDSQSAGQPGAVEQPEVATPAQPETQQGTTSQ